MGTQRDPGETQENPERPRSSLGARKDVQGGHFKAIFSDFGIIFGQFLAISASLGLFWGYFGLMELQGGQGRARRMAREDQGEVKELGGTPQEAREGQEPGGTPETQGSQRSPGSTDPGGQGAPGARERQ